MSASRGGRPTSSTKDAPQGTQALQRALSLLERLRLGPAGLAELADGEGLARPTAHRLLAGLESRRLVERQGVLYAAGPGLVAWGARAALTRAGSWPAVTPLFERQVTDNESLAWRDWAGHAAPVHYEPEFHREYWAIRQSAGILDVSPLYKYEFFGADAEVLAQRLLTRDVSRCRVGQVMYGCWCNDDGDVLQDGNLWRLGEQHFRLSAADPSLRWFEDCASDLDVEVRDTSRELAALAVQGPRSHRILEQLFGVSVGDLGYFRGTSLNWRGGEIGLTRTGFTGDLGYEVWIPGARAEEVWDALLAVGREHGALPAGLAALDAVRIEAGLVLIEVDFFSAAHCLLDERKSTPYDLGLGWTVKLVDGNDFVGRRALEQRAREWTVCGLEVTWPELERHYRARGLRPQMVGHGADRTAVPLRLEGEVVGQVTSRFFSPLLKRHIGLCSIRLEAFGLEGDARDQLLHGRAVELELDIERERVAAVARLCALPHYDPPHKRAKLGRDAPRRSASPGSGETGGAVAASRQT